MVVGTEICLLGIATATIVILLFRAAKWMTIRVEKERAFAKAVDQFFANAEVLLADDRTPQPVVEFLNKVSAGLDDAKLVRRIVWRAVLGRLREDAKHPPAGMREFLRDLSGMSEAQQTNFARAMGSAFVASALRAGFIGELFLRIMLPDPERQKETTTAYAAEVQGFCAAA